MKILLITRKRGVYGYGNNHPPSGLINSVRFIVEMLENDGIEAKGVDVVDSHRIDKEVHDYRPTHVVISALWVPPKKFEVLIKLHPTVTWIVRLHSDLPFLSGEGNAVRWIYRYMEMGIEIAANSGETAKELSGVLGHEVILLPNYYKLCHKKEQDGIKIVKDDGHHYEHDHINIGCFGAIRPLKNQLTQAVAAIEFANKHHKRLHFYMNTGRVERGGEPIVRNLQALFAENPQHKLVEIGWLYYEDFLELVRKMDLGLQVSLSETFDIVAADMVNCGVPMVVSNEVYWASPDCMADPNRVESIVRRMGEVCRDRGLVKKNRRLLHKSNDIAEQCWLGYLCGKRGLTWKECLFGWLDDEV